ncbi:Mediator of RNA polymerase II transcription subunit 25 [Porites harrisoni]
MMALKTAADVKSWPVDKGFEEYATKFYENQIDGAGLFSLTERALQQLIPVIGHRMKFLMAIKDLESKVSYKEDENGEAAGPGAEL